MKHILILLVPISIVVSSCDLNNRETTGSSEIPGLNGKELMERNCYSCHNTQGTENMLAPPMFRVKDHYWEEGITKDEFVQSIVDWVKDPKEENSLMPGARRKFGLMPKQSFDENEVKAIAEYMFESEL